jgi:hypothetical protein
VTSNFTTPAMRASNRLSLQIPVSIHGRCKDMTEFHEDTSTLIVNSGGALVPLSTNVSLGDSIRVVNKTTNREQTCRVAFLAKDVYGVFQAGVAFRSPVANFWRITRREPRIPTKIRVKVRGVDHDGNAFVQSAHAMDISRHGVRLDGIGYVAEPGQIIEVKRFLRTTRFRVLWVGGVGTPEADQAGAFSLESNKNFWGSDLP